MTEFKPWEEKPDDGYWRALLGTSAGPPVESGTASIASPPVATAPEAVGVSTNGNAHPAETETVLTGWALAEKSYAQGDTLELRVVGYNRGGLLVDLGPIRGFVPASQLTSFPRQVHEDERMQELAHYMNSSLRLKVIEFDRARNRLILSERIANPPVSRADQVLATIQPQQKRKGVIRNITDFGAFVDLGGVEGLIHVSEFSWQHIPHPRDAVSPGQEVEVYIMDVDRDQKRIACSLKRLSPNPWMQLAERLHPGDYCDGVVTNVVAFGAFVRVTEAVEVYIMDVDRDQKRIACSLKRLSPNPWMQLAERLHPGDYCDGVVTNVVAFGAFVRVAEAVEGLIHVSELAEGSFLHPRDVVEEGQRVRARVINIDPARQRLGLSLRNGASAAPDVSEPAQWDDPSIPAEPAHTHRPASVDGELPPPPPSDPGYWESLAQSST